MIRTIRPGVTMIAALLAALGWTFLNAAPASAGGPTSVIMVNPASGHAAALHTTNARYAQLVDAVDAYGAVTGPDTAPTGVSDCFECEVRLTWLIHDMQVWRIDRVHRIPGGDVWIETVSVDATDDAFERPGRWHRPHDAAALLALLKAEGLTSATAADPPGRQPAGADSTPAAGAAQRAASVGTEKAALPVGLVAAGAGTLGVLAGVGGSWWLRRSRSGRERIQLLG